MSDCEQHPIDIGRRLTLGGLAASSVVMATGAGAAPPSRWQQGSWLNAPRQHRVLGDDVLEVVTDKGTDFWRETHYGFTRDSGHFLGFAAPAAFTCQLRIRGRFDQLYDQAGIMIRANERQWVKAGIELSDGRAMLSSVLTDGRSDWATGPYEGDPSDFWMRATIEKGVLRLQASRDGIYWPLVRLCPFPVAASYLAGPMTCTPEREGLKVQFSDWQLGPVLGKELHDLS
ncbi:regulation of enolase 1 [Xanthomonas cannabis pv. phaseoli]|uniref:Regulation of enolase 1 n=1 Tax=Xanthomonas cannabis pv. phaseoli TaxID=1885902 RepID=A0AB34P933_9XANT|nr:regulation of enolase 1 [Xanthomonas cannabis pv. phaseoli]